MFRQVQFTRFAVFFILIFPYIQLSAQNKPEQESDSTFFKSLAEVVITSNRFESIKFNTPDAVGVTGISSSLKSQLRTSPEAMILSPGVFVQKTNHGGGSPFLRGLTGNQTLLLIDGIRLSNATYRYGPNQYFNTIDIFSIGKIEVLRGSGSVQYGSDAIGGTIQTFTHTLSLSAEPEWGSSLKSRISTAGMEQSLNGSVDFSGKKITVRGGLTYRNFGDIKGGDTTGVQAPTGYNELDYDLKGLIKLTESADLTFVMQSVHQNDIPVYHKVVLENYAVNRMDPQSRKLGYMRLDKKTDAGVLRSISITASLQQTEEGRESRKSNSSSLRYENDKVRSFGFIAEALMSDGNIWSASNGAEYYNDIVSSTRIDRDLNTGNLTAKRGLYPDDASTNSIALFSLHTIDFEKWILTAGARFNTYIINVYDEVLGQTKLKPSALVGNLAVLRKINSKSNIFVSANSGFRAPNIDDLGTLGIVDFRYETPNFELTPEHSYQYQAGYKFQDRNVKGEIYFYRNELRNLIVRNIVAGDTIDGYPVYKKENVEKAYIQGIETAWDIEINNSLQLSAALTYTYGENITKNEPVRRIPPLFGRLGAEYNFNNLKIGAECLAAAKQTRLAAGDKSDNRIPSGGTPGWCIFNLNAGYEAGLLSIGLSLQNLFNEDYRYHGSGVNGPGRMALLSVGINLGNLK